MAVCQLQEVSDAARLRGAIKRAALNIFKAISCEHRKSVAAQVANALSLAAREPCLKNTFYCRAPPQDDRGLTDALRTLMSIGVGSQHQRPPRVRLQKVERLPKYFSWVPVQTCFYIGNRMPHEPYLPFLGDDQKSYEASLESFKRQCGSDVEDSEYSDEEELRGEPKGKQEGRSIINSEGRMVIDLTVSDSELEDAQTQKLRNIANGGMVSRSAKDSSGEYSSRKNMLRRASERLAILEVVKRYGSKNYVFQVLAETFKLGSVQRVKAIYQLARQRLERWKEREDAARSSKRRKKAYLEARHVASENDVCHLGSDATFRYFCRHCCKFGCEQHEGLHVVPLNPPPDGKLREKKTQSRRGSVIRTCGALCGVEDSEGYEPPFPPPVDVESWSEFEKRLATSALELFGEDPCRIAKVVGSRSCQDVVVYLRSLDSAAKSNALKIFSQNHRAKSPSPPLEEHPGTSTLNSTGQNKGVARKDIRDTHDAFEDADDLCHDHRPCSHSGKCENNPECPCTSRGLPCEMACACNSVRWTGNGMIGKRCSAAVKGCSCEYGRCTDMECPCWEKDRGCDPDLCNHCGANILPGSAEEGTRRCRNVTFHSLKRKRTFVGVSEVHGYGLFAGERFEKDDFVGEYTGATLHSEIVERLGGVADAKGVTYFYDSTKTHTVDGMILGNKTRLINHIDAEKQNVYPRAIRVRTDIRLGLFAARVIHPGEELRMDYKFQSVVPDYAHKSPVKEKNKDSNEEEVVVRSDQAADPAVKERRLIRMAE